MKTDRVFVLLLVVLLPLTGCFDDAVGEADAQEDTSSGTTVINNYYNATEVQYYAMGGVEVMNTTTTVATFNTSAGEMVNIIETSNSGSSVHIYTNCSDGASFTRSLYMITEYLPVTIGGSYDDCVHEVSLNPNTGLFTTGTVSNQSWSFVYELVPVNVV